MATDESLWDILAEVDLSEEAEAEIEAAGAGFTQMEGAPAGVMRGFTEEEAAAQRGRAERAARRAALGLESERLFQYATRLAEIGAGRVKTEAAQRAERAVEILTGAQRGVAAAGAGIDAARRLRRGERAAERAEVAGEARVAQARELEQQAAREQLEQLLIQGEQRALDREFAMAQMQLQQEQASGAMWGQVLSGILGATGTLIGAGLGGPAGAMAGGAVGGAMGTGVGRWAS